MYIQDKHYFHFTHFFRYNNLLRYCVADLEESRDELQAAAAIQAGRELLMLNIPRPGYDTLDAAEEGDACSLAVELSADAIRDRNSQTRQAKQPVTMAEVSV